MKECRFCLLLLQFYIMANIPCAGSTNLTHGLIAYYPFNGNAADESGHSHSGTVVNAMLTIDRFGQVDRAYRFHADTDYINIGNGIKPPLPLSCSVWVYGEPGGHVIYNDDVDTYRYGAAITYHGKVTASFYQGYANSGNRRGKATIDQFASNTWHHVVAVYNNANDIRIYVNGVERDGTYAGTGTTMLYSSAKNGTIGRGNYDIGYRGNIDDIRVYNRALASNEVAQLYAMESRPTQGMEGWRYARKDLAGSCFDPNGSKVRTTTNLVMQYSIAAAWDGSFLTGDVTGDGNLDIVNLSGSKLSIYDNTGSLIREVAMPQSGCWLTILEDANGDGVLDIGVGVYKTTPLNVYFFDGNGNLLKTLSKSGGDSCCAYMWPHTILPNGKVIVGVGAGYVLDPRGYMAFDYASGQELWHFDTGPSVYIRSIADIDNDGKYEITGRSGTVNNGATGDGHNHNGTTTRDNAMWLIVADEDGNEKCTYEYPAPDDGVTYHYFADLNGDKTNEILGFERHYSPYNGMAQVHLFDHKGNLLNTVDGLQDQNWTHAVADLTQNGKQEVIASCGGSKLFLLDSSLNVIKTTNISGWVRAVCDVDGDHALDILLTDDTTLRLLNTNLEVFAQYDFGTSVGLITTDIDNDGKVEMLCKGDAQLYVMEMGLAAPPGVSASDGDFTNRIHISWNAVGGAINYEIWRSATTNRNDAVLWTNAVQTSFNDYSLSQGLAFTYWIKARGPYDISPFSQGDSGYVDDAYEQNDSRIAACDISTNANVWLSSLRGSGRQWDDDWYRIAAAPGSERLVVTCAFTHTSGDIDLRLYNNNSELLTSSENEANEETLDVVVPVSDYYYLRIYRSNLGNTYDLWWDNITVSGATGTMVVSLSPSEALMAGAAWQIAGSGSNWFESGSSRGMNTGAYTVVFKQLQGWYAPANIPLVVRSGTITNILGQYIRKIPQALFSAISLNGVAPLTVTFNDESSGMITNRVWDFDSNGTPETTNPAPPIVHIYNEPGIYSPSLTISGPGGTTNLTRINYITVNTPPPTAAFAADVTAGAPPLSVTFTDQSSGSITTRLWDFDNDGQTDAVNPDPPIVFAYTNVGNYTVKLTVQGTGGSDSEIKSSYIAVSYVMTSSNHPPHACLATQQIYLRSLADMALLDASCSWDPDGDPLYYSWREAMHNPVHGLIPLGSESMAQLPIYFPTPGRYGFAVRLSDGEDVSPEALPITVYVPGIKGTVKYRCTDNLVCVPDARLSAYATALDAELHTNPVDVAISDSLGEFMFHSLAPASTIQPRDYYVCVERSGFDVEPVSTLTVSPDPGVGIETVFTLARGQGMVRGQITTTNEQPIQNALVAIVAGVGSNTISDQTDINGNFDMFNVPYGSWTVQLLANGFRPRVVDLSVGPAMAEQRFAMTPVGIETNHSLQGTVTMAGVNWPVANVQVSLGTGAGMLTYTDSQGHYSFDGIPAGMYMLIAAKAGFMPLRKPMLDVRGTETQHIVLQPSDRFVIQGSVIDATSGRPIYGAMVSLMIAKSQMLQHDMTDRTGFYMLRNLSPMTHVKLLVAAAGYQTQTLTLNTTTDLEMDDVVLNRASHWTAPHQPSATPTIVPVLTTNVYYLNTLSQIVTLDASPSIGSNLVYLWSELEDNPEWPMIPAGSENMSSIQLKAFSKPGIYHYKLIVQGYGTISAHAALAIVYVPGMAGHVHASPTDGIIGLSGFTVRAYTNYYDAVNLTSGYRLSKQTDDYPPGCFTMNSLSTGDYWIVAYKPGSEYANYGPVLRRVNYQPTLGYLNINMARNEYNVEGIVQDYDTKQPLVNARIVIAPGLRTESFRTVTDSSGYYKLHAAPAGSQYILFMRDSYRTEKSTQNIYTNMNLDFALQSASDPLQASLKGCIKVAYDNIGLPLPDVEITVGSGLAQTYTDQSGWFQIDDLPTGYYMVYVRRKGYVATYLDNGGITKLEAGENVRNRTLQFRTRGPNIKGLLCDQQGKHLANARISVLASDVQAQDPNGKYLFLGGEKAGLYEMSSAIYSDASGGFQLIDVPHGERMLWVELTNGVNFATALQVTDNMEASIQVPPSLSGYEVWHSQYFANTNVVGAGMQDDPDHDHMNNWQEYLADTTPTKADALTISQTSFITNRFGFCMEYSSANRVYEIYGITNLLHTNWLFYGVSRSGTGSNLQLHVTNMLERGYFKTHVRLP